MKKTVFITSIMLFLITLFYIASGLLLTYKKPVKSPYVLLEGWLSHYHMEFAANHIMEIKYNSVFIVGMKNKQHGKSIQQVKKTDEGYID